MAYIRPGGWRVEGRRLSRRAAMLVLGVLSIAAWGCIVALMSKIFEAMR